MSNANILRNIGNTLRNLLVDTDLWGGPNQVPDIVFDSPKRLQNSENTISLFLYQIMESPYLRYEGLQRGKDDSQLLPPPLSLDLMYLVTPYGSDNVGELYILGKVMQRFFDNPILPSNQIQDGIRDEDGKIMLILNPISLDDQTKIWSAFQDVGYRSSICYKVTPVRIDSTRDISVQRVMSIKSGLEIQGPNKKGD